jgi:hypothetical protein
MRLLLFGVLRDEHASPEPSREHYDLDGKHFYFNPTADFRLQPHDLMVVIGYENSLNRFKAKIGTKGRSWPRR